MPDALKDVVLKESKQGDGKPRRSFPARATRRGEWYFRRATSSLRTLPDFIIIGAPRCGTTSMWEMLADHPEVLPSFRKEVHFFDLRFGRGVNWYRAHFPVATSLRSGRITGEGTPNYLSFPSAPERVRSVVPDAKLLVLLRNPISRAHSAWQLKVREGVEQLPFEEALNAEESRMTSDPDRLGAAMQYAYRGKSRYAEQLEAWFDLYPREQFLILKSEEIFGADTGALAEVHRFLGIRSVLVGGRPAAVPKANASPNGAALDPKLHLELADYFAPHNRRLYELIGRDLGWS